MVGLSKIDERKYSPHTRKNHIGGIMELKHAIFNRRTIHKYRDTPVPIEVIESCIEAAHQAPNHRLTFPWHFTIAGPQTRTALFRSAVEMRRSMPGMTDKVEETIREKLLNPGGLVFVSLKKCEDTFRAREDYAAASCAIQNFMLSAYGYGFGTKWSTGTLTRLDSTYKIADVNPDTHEIIGFIWVGEAVRIPSIERPDVNEHTTVLN